MFYHHPFDDSPEVWYDKIHAEKQNGKKKKEKIIVDSYIDEKFDFYPCLKLYLACEVRNN